MTYIEVFNALNGIAIGENETIPVAYYQFPADDPNNPAPPPPFICYYYEGSNDFLADGTNYQTIRPLTVELYTDNKDFDIEQAVETALNAAGLVFTRTETYIDTEQLYLVTYYADVVVTPTEE